MEDDAIMLKQKKRKVAIDPDQEDEEQFKAVTTKTQEEKPDRENFEHKTNGDKPKEVKKQPEKKEEAKPDKSDAKNASPTKPRPPADKDKQNVKKDTDQKPPAKPKPAASDSDKKASEANGQVQKKAPEEKKSSQKPPAKKKPEPESESEGSDEESDEESESEDDKPKKKQVSKPKPKAKPSPKPKAKKDSEPGGKKVVGKDVLVYDVLKRWWYCLPDWPPVGYDYSAELEKRKLRKVDQKYWRIEPEKDAKDFTKVYEIPSYPGVFKNSKGERIDLRPKDTCPSFEVFRKKSIPDLLDLKITALKNQVEALEKSVVVDEDLLKELKKELAVAEKTRAKMAEKAEGNKK